MLKACNAREKDSQAAVQAPCLVGSQIPDGSVVQPLKYRVVCDAGMFPC